MGKEKKGTEKGDEGTENGDGNGTRDRKWDVDQFVSIGGLGPCVSDSSEKPGP